MRLSSPVIACGQHVIISTPNIAECGQVGSSQVKSAAGGAGGQIFGKLKIGLRAVDGSRLEEDEVVDAATAPVAALLRATDALLN